MVFHQPKMSIISGNAGFWWIVDKKNRQTIVWRSFVGGGSRIRTGDPMLAKHVLYQLSYTPSGRPWQS